MKPQVEILAPAGSMESMAAAVHAGADAVYMGGSRFGARAYADNPEEDQFLEALDYAHLHGCRIYMTVNTLVKEAELPQLADFLRPCYERGLDGVIVQDLGVLSLIRNEFPDLPIHASTQMTITGWRGAALLKDMGASRVVTARELSLEEIREIHSRVPVEIESFVHGALCYCYSGQCLLSSLIGGRSGNRGRCAQPCRLPYGKAYLLSLKDLCTLDCLPDIIEAGVFSLKIEGRMKSPRYTAGVVSVYRKYVDRYLQKGRQGYEVDPEDRQILLDLFDRGGFTEGYYRQHNGRDMIALKEKPAFREGNQKLFDWLDREYVNKKKQEPMKGRVVAREGLPLRLELSMRDGQIRSTTEGEVVQTAQNQPLTEERLLRQMGKTGNAPFFFQHLEAEVAGNGFVPLQAMNELRRRGIEALEQEALKPFRRSPEGKAGRPRPAEEEAWEKKKGKENAYPLEKGIRLHVCLEEPRGLSVALDSLDTDQICLDAAGFGAETWVRAAALCHKAGKRCALILPHIFRKEAEHYLLEHLEEGRQAGFDELILRSLEEIYFLDANGLGEIPKVMDANLYAMNHMAARQLSALGAARLTLPLEENSRELEELCRSGFRPRDGWELPVYGYLPAMVSAQCIVRTTRGCTRKPELIKIKDRMGKELPVKNHCRFCYNTIYNPSPLSLLGMEKTVSRIHPSVLRLTFSMESPETIGKTIRDFADCFRYGREVSPQGDFTRGHMKRGVE